MRKQKYLWINPIVTTRIFKLFFSIKKNGNIDITTDSFFFEKKYTDGENISKEQGWRGAMEPILHLLKLIFQFLIELFQTDCIYKIQ